MYYYVNVTKVEIFLTIIIFFVVFHYFIHRNEINYYIKSFWKIHKR